MNQDQKLLKQNQKLGTNKKISSEKLASESTSQFSNLFNCWCISFVKFCSNFHITKDNLQSLPEQDQTKNQFDRWEKNWQAEKEKSEEKILNNTIKRTFKNEIIKGFIFDFISLQCNVLTPLLAYILVNYIKEGNLIKSTNLTFLGLILACRLLRSFFDMRAQMVLRKLGSSIYSCVCLAIIKKSLRYSTLCNKQYSVGQIANMVQLDCAKIIQLPRRFSGLIFTIYSLFFILCVIVFIAGWPGLIGFVIFIVFTLVRISFAQKGQSYQKQINENTDKRISTSTEIINNIKFIKVNAYQGFYLENLLQKRVNQINSFNKKLVTQLYPIFLSPLGSKLVLILTVIIFLAVGNTISTTMLFGMNISFNYVFLNQILSYLSTSLDAFASLNKVQKYLLVNQIDNKHITWENKLKDVALKMSHGNFYWEKEQQASQFMGISENHLSDINLEIKKGQLVAIIGEYGSGKSSFFNSLLSQMKCDNQNNIKPSIQINGKIAYCNQKPWIINDTVKNNIVFGKTFQQKRYKQVLEYACLKSDLEIFPEGDQTMIGERGSTLSGGQKARISLARALYSNADIYLFDDIFSAVDVHVGNFLISKTLIQYLKGKTILLITHSIYYLKYVDRILIIENGKLLINDTYENLKDHRYLSGVGMTRFSSQRLSKKQTLKQQSYKSIQLRKSLSSKRQIEKKISLQFEQLKQQTEQKKSNWQLLCLYISLNSLVPFLIVLALYLFLSVSVGILQLFWLVKWGDASDSSDFYYSYIFLLLSLVQCLAYMIAPSYQLWTPLYYNVHLKMVVSLMFASLNSYFEVVPAASIINRLSKDLNIIDINLYFSFSCLVNISFGLWVIFFVFLIAQKWIFLLILIAYIFLIFIVYKYSLIVSRQLNRLENETKSPMLSCFNQILQGLSTIRAYRSQQFFSNKNIYLIDDCKKTMRPNFSVEIWFNYITAVLSSLLSIIVIAIILFQENHNSQDVMIATLIFSLEETSFLANYFLRVVVNEFKALDRCSQFFQIQPEKGYLNYLKQRSQTNDYRRKDQIWITQGELKLINYSVRYRPNLDPALRNVSAVIKPKQKIGIVGRTGSGKSTLLLSLFRILEASSGRIEIDGVDISKLSLQQLRSNMTIIMQDHYLFTGSIRQNIDLMGIYSDQKIIRALKLTKLWPQLQARSGLNTKITESGDNFSSGQKQLLNITRSLLNPKKIVLVDEATANIDIETDKVLQEVIASEFKQMTVLTIAHRINTIINSDRILVFDKGEIKEFDTPKNLLKNKNSIFYKLHQESGKNAEEQNQQ